MGSVQSHRGVVGPVCALAFVLGALGGPVFADASSPAAAKLLVRMAHAMRSLNYDGTFVYLHDNRLEALRIIHLVEEGKEREKLISLNGAERDVTRDSQQVTCRLSNAAAIAVNKRGAAQDILLSHDVDPEALSESYLLHPLGDARVAGRQADVVGVIPRDSYRYGYRFFIDKETGLLLKSDLMDEAAKPIEQIMFTSLSLEPQGFFEESEPKSQVFTWQRGKPVVERAVSEAQPSWFFEGLPVGFELSLRDRWQDAQGKVVDHLLLTDGLASMSVYIEKDGQDGLKGGTRMGAINAWGGTVAGHQVTVVGEVPAVTAEKVFSAIRHSDG